MAAIFSVKSLVLRAGRSHTWRRILWSTIAISNAIEVRIGMFGENISPWCRAALHLEYVAYLSIKKISTTSSSQRMRWRHYRTVKMPISLMWKALTLRKPTFYYIFSITEREEEVKSEKHHLSISICINPGGREWFLNKKTGSRILTLTFYTSIDAMEIKLNRVSRGWSLTKR